MKILKNCNLFWRVNRIDNNAALLEVKVHTFAFFMDFLPISRAITIINLQPPPILHLIKQFQIPKNDVRFFIFLLLL